MAGAGAATAIVAVAVALSDIIWSRVVNRSKCIFNISTLQSIVDDGMMVCSACVRYRVRRTMATCSWGAHQKNISKTIVQKFAPFAYKFSHVNSIVCVRAHTMYVHDAFLLPYYYVYV